jgi:hypothetical protein
MESFAHVVNGCFSYKDLYIARHDPLVDLIASEVRQVVLLTAHMLKHSCVRGSWFDVDDDVFSCVSNTPDIVVVGRPGGVAHFVNGLLI